MSKPKLLIIDKAQYGYLIDSYKWCEYLKDNFDITYLCYEYGLKKLSTDGIKIHYIPSGNNKIWRFIRWNIASLWHVARNNGLTIAIYQKGCTILKRVFPFKKIIMDVRTLSVHQSAQDRTNRDSNLRRSAKLFDAVTIISQGVSDKIGNIGEVKKHILPLGADVISNRPKKFDSIRMLYVGTFTNRNLEKTLYGLKMWLDNNPTSKISYDIIGDGNTTELKDLQLLSDRLNLNEFVHFHGRLPYNELTPFFDDCNVGVSFVPMTDYYEYQPPTKAYEYSLSGLYVIGTKTFAQRQIISKDNGILINDTAEDFCNAISYISQHLPSLNEQKIREALSAFTWKNIVNNNLLPFLKGQMNLSDLQNV